MDSPIPLIITLAGALSSLGLMAFAAYAHLAPGAFRDRHGARCLLLAAALGAAAPVLWFETRQALADLALPDLSTLALRMLLEFFRSLGIAGLAVMVVYKWGLRQPIALWSVAALCALPMGFIMANPVDFRFTPTEQDFNHGPNTADMVIYMALFGLSGLAYGRLREARAAAMLAAARAGLDWQRLADDSLLSNRRFLQQLIDHAPLVFQHLPSWARSDAKLSALAVRRRPDNVVHLPVDFAVDRDAALAMLRGQPNVFEFMPEPVRADMGCATMAVRLHPPNLQHVGTELRRDKALVLEAVHGETLLNSPHDRCLSLEFAAPELRQDADILEAAQDIVRFKMAHRDASWNR